MMALETQNYSMSLVDLFMGLADVSESVDVTGLAIDSRKVAAGDLFMAYQGTYVNGVEYIDAAIKAGAAAIAIDVNEDINSEVYPIPVIRVRDLRKQVGLIASRYFGEPSKAMHVIGVTGTNGKTTVSYLIAQALNKCGQRSGLIGTLGYGRFQQIESGTMTTPDSIKLHSLFSSWRNEVDSVAMEVSSHALDQGRVAGVEFETAVFTNLSRDHLDYHDSLDSYGEAKSQLFNSPELKHAVINADDAYGKKLIKQLSGKIDLVAFTLNKNEFENISDIKVVSCEIEKGEGLITKIYIESPWGKANIKTSLLGEFNLENVLAAYSALCLRGIPAKDVAEAISGFKGVPGRMETFFKKDKPLLVVDYAHTPDALEKSLKALRLYCKGRLYCVFGCGGDRDTGKRELMGQVAEAFADKVVLTNDNPRTELQEQIIEHILQGIKNRASVTIKYDRSDAIINTFINADKDDVVLIAGKGHETTQQIGKDLLPFSDRELARRLTEGDT